MSDEDDLGPCSSVANIYYDGEHYVDSTIVRVHPDGTGARKKTALTHWDAAEADGAPKCIWLPRMIATS